MKHAVVLFLLLSVLSSSTQASKYASLFSFGDSYTDTGNIIIIDGPTSPDLWVNKPPYGMTFFGHPAGRISDGRIIVDFIAEALGLPLLPPALAANQNFQQGANFAVGGATTLNITYQAPGRGVRAPPSNISLSAQLGWFDAMKPKLCSSPKACSEYFGKALFVIGELGYNDYGLLFLGGKSVGEVQSAYVPRIVETISAAAEKLINDGATAIVVSGVPPLGCAPGNLVLLASPNGADYEPDTGCLKNLNLLSKEHNAQLSQALATLRGKYPGARITYADLYSPVIEFVASPGRYGFDGTSGALRTCCGSGGGKYNFNLTRACGMPGVSACANPAKYVNWDGVHLTEAAYHRVADGWLRGPFANPPILS